MSIIRKIEFLHMFHIPIWMMLSSTNKRGRFTYFCRLLSLRGRKSGPITEEEGSQTQQGAARIFSVTSIHPIYVYSLDLDEVGS